MTISRIAKSNMRFLNNIAIVDDQLINDGVVSGYASVFWTIDKQNDVIVPGAFDNFCQSKQSIPLLYGHNQSNIIGSVVSGEEDRYGLKIISIIYNKYLSLVTKKNNLSLSIGFNVIEAKFDEYSGYNNIIKANLIEISIVDHPANEFAKLSSVILDNDRMLFRKA